jgi:hypothetical protein
MKHATVKIGEYTVPLIGVPQNATEETCDKCGKKCHIGDMTLGEDMTTTCQQCLQATQPPNDQAELSRQGGAGGQQKGQPNDNKL